MNDLTEENNPIYSDICICNGDVSYIIYYDRYVQRIVYYEGA